MPTTETSTRQAATLSNATAPEDSGAPHVLRKRHATMKDVATLAGVGTKTVSRVINGESNVSDELARRVRQAAEQLNYTPNLQASNLRRAAQRTQTIGLLVGSVANQFYGAIHRSIEETVRERSMAVLASSLDDDPQRERAAVEVLLRRRVDGLVMTPVGTEHAYLATLAQQKVPLVCIDREPVGFAADTVVSDNLAGARRGTRHLLGHGHTRLAYLGDRGYLQSAQQRKAGFLRALGEAGVPFTQAQIVEGLHSEDLAERAALRLLSGAQRPTAIFSAQNLVTIGVFRALKKLGLERAIALVGFDDLDMADLVEPGITVVAQHPGRIGYLAAKVMLERLDGDGQAARTITVDTTMHIRGSGEIRGPGL